MEAIITIIALVAGSFSINASAQDKQTIEIADQATISIEKKKKLNFFVVSKRKKGKLDPATRFNVLRSKIKSLLRPKNFVAIVASDADHASTKILHRLEKYNANIGTIWFDSHGAYKKGYSLFYIGHDEINYKNLKDLLLKSPFNLLTPYSTAETKLVIGSCYGGATYTRASIDYKDTTRMNGDSLMIALGKLFPQARIYGSESWVMTKPGIFNDHKMAVAGFPKRKLFRDVCYKPAWERMGKWNEYDAATNLFAPVNPVTLDSYGNVQITRQSFAVKTETKNDIQKNITRLESGLYK